MERHIHGGDLTHYDHCLDFSTNINPLGTPPGVMAAVQESLSSLSVYPQPDSAKLRACMAEKEGVPSPWVLPGNGATGLIFTVCRAIQPKRTLLTAPAFAEYERAVRSVGANIRFFMRRKEEGFALTEDYLDCLTERIDLAYLCNPNNPDGGLIDEELLLKILDKCKKEDIHLVMDECFLDLTLEGRSRSLVKYLKDYPQLIIVKAFTKSHGLAALRLGYLLTSDAQLLQHFEDFFIPWEISGPAQAAGIAAVNDVEHLKEANAMIASEKERLSRFLREEMGYQCYPSSTNFLLFEAPQTLFQDCARRGILIRDCSNFRGLEPGFFRIAVRTPEENEKLMEVFRVIRERKR